MDVDSSTDTSTPSWPDSAGGLILGTLRSEQHFYKDGSMFLTLTDNPIVYCVWGSHLSRYSGFFQDLESLPPPPNVETDTDMSAAEASSDPEEASSDTEKVKALALARDFQKAGGNGKSETTPLTIQATPVQFEVFLDCLFTQTGDNIQALRPAAFWEMALQMGDFFDCTRVTNLATEWLSRHRDLDPALRLHLAMTYSIKQWVKPAVEVLIRTRLADLSPAQINQIGFSPYIILTEAQAKIAEHRVLCSLTVPDVVHTGYCTDKEACGMSWAHAWWGETTKHGIAVALIHPGQPQV
ncbi:hypothetical protein C8R46DRAFT_1121725, partial [Mycena filopes]